MTPYKKIFSRFLGKVTDFTFISLEESDLIQMQIEWLHSAIYKPKVRNLFKNIVLDDELNELEFSLKNSIDEYSDEEFIVEILSLGMAIEWLQPQVDSIIHTAPMIGGKEEKKLLDNHKESIARLDSMKTEQKKLIRDYGYLNNSYINGD